MKIVEVIKPYESDVAIVLTTPSRQVWLCESRGSDLVWSDMVGQPMHQGPAGPIPDEFLWPIRPHNEDAPSEANDSCIRPTREAAVSR
jgi:hypothetical protein